MSAKKRGRRAGKARPTRRAAKKGVEQKTATRGKASVSGKKARAKARRAGPPTRRETKAAPRRAEMPTPREGFSVALGEASPVEVLEVRTVEVVSVEPSEAWDRGLSG
jgi:hypothetical protein